MDFPHAAVAFGAAFLAGAINSVAGGGTLVSFPALIWLGLDSVAANATSTVAIWPGTVGSAWGYRREIRTAEARFLALIVPSLAGGLIGAVLLRYTPTAIFDRMVPFLILFATLLFMAQDPMQRMLGTAEGPATTPPVVRGRHAVPVVRGLVWRLFRRRYRHSDVGGAEHHGPAAISTR